MEKLQFILFLLSFNFCIAQDEVVEIKNQSGVTTQYKVETGKILSATGKGQLSIAFIHSINNGKHYLELTIPESRYRRIYLQDSVRLIFDDAAVYTLPVATEQKSYMRKDKGEWLVYQFYLPFQIELSERLLSKFTTNSLKHVYFICVGNGQDLSGDYASVYYPVSAADKKKFQQYAAKDIIFSRQSINKKGQITIQTSANRFISFLKAN